MLTSEIQSLADFENSGAPDFPTGQVLRAKVIPEFMSRVGMVEWRRLTETLQFAPDVRYQDINPHFSLIEQVWLVDPRKQLRFIGDDPWRMLISTKDFPDPVQPAEYFITNNRAGVYTNAPAPLTVDGQSGPRRLNLGAPSDAIYSVAVFGWAIPYFENNTDDVDMNPWIPIQFQWALVDGLRAEIFRVRYGTENIATLNARAEFDKGIALASEISGTTIEQTPRYA